LTLGFSLGSAGVVDLLDLAFHVLEGCRREIFDAIVDLVRDDDLLGLFPSAPLPPSFLLAPLFLVEEHALDFTFRSSAVGEFVQAAADENRPRRTFSRKQVEDLVVEFHLAHQVAGEFLFSS